MFSDGPAEIDCLACSDYQTLVCYDTYCPTELNNYLACDPGFSDCSAVTTALMSCITANESVVTSCLNARVFDCFP